LKVGIQSTYSALAKRIPAVRSLRFLLDAAYARLTRKAPESDEYGWCSVCGGFSRFSRGRLSADADRILQESGYDETYIRELAVTNTLNCWRCGAKFRVRCAASSLLRRLHQGRFSSVAQLVRRISHTDSRWRALETGTTAGIFTRFQADCIVKSEYYDSCAAGDYFDNIRCEDLQALSFENASLDLVVALDVLEHIAEPWRAFAEVWRVLKPEGIGLVTVPIEPGRLETATVAVPAGGAPRFLGNPRFHPDPLRREGAVVFTEFGRDLGRRLVAEGYSVEEDHYRLRCGAKQSVFLMLRK